jgi:transcriptional regulator with GAF, ATPase, and Fis domain
MPSTVHNWETLFELARVLSRQSSLEETLRYVAHSAATLLEAETALIMMINPQTRQTFKTVVREGAQEHDPKYHAVQTQIAGWLMQSHESLLSADLKNDPRFAKVKLGEAAIKSVIAVSLRCEGLALGSLMVFNPREGGAFAESDLAYLEKIAVIAAPYLRNVQGIQQYFTPPLTDLNLRGKYEELGLLGKSKAFVQLLQTIEAAARCEVRVQLQGESGTGKERIARAIHQFSSRGNQPFVAIDCGAIPSHLIESELFGHVKGAFTGAVSDRKGLLDEAHRGTFFMDEIANLPLEMQSKLMRFLQEGEVRPVGSNKAHTVDVRIISASSRSLQQMVEAKQFREDLFYRLHVYPIHVPSLHERRVDLPLLAHHFVKKFSAEQGKHAQQFSSGMLEFLQQRKWPGNIRELENFVERLVALAPAEKETLDHKILPVDLAKEYKRFEPVLEDLHVAKSLSECVEEYERQLIRKVLHEQDWNQSQAGRVLKIPVQTLRYKMNKLGIVKPE